MSAIIIIIVITIIIITNITRRPDSGVDVFGDTLVCLCALLRGVQRYTKKSLFFNAFWQLAVVTAGDDLGLAMSFPGFPNVPSSCAAVVS